MPKPLTMEQQQLVVKAMVNVNGMLSVPCMACYVDKLGREEARNIAYLALCVAASKWRPDGGANFEGYATWWVRSHLVAAAVQGGVMRDASVRVGGRAGPRKQMPEIQEWDWMADGPEKEIDNRDLLALIARKLDRRSRQMLFMASQGYTRQQIADKFWMSKQRVQQIIHEAQRLIADAMGERSDVWDATNRRAA